MNVTKDGNGVNITGLTENQALVLMSMVGNLTGLRVEGLYEKFMGLFPEYNKVWAKHYNVESPTIILSEKQKKAHTTIIDEILNARAIRPKTISNQRRDTNGRFARKFWVARFSYPDSQNRWSNVARTVITNNFERRPPDYCSQEFYCYPTGIFIEGIDLARNAFRKFSVNKIVGQIKWTKEYASDVR